MNRRVQPRHLVLLAVTFSVLVAAVVFGASIRGGNPPATRYGAPVIDAGDGRSSQDAPGGVRLLR